MNRRIPKAGHDRLIERTWKVGRHEFVATAVGDYIRRRAQFEIVSLFGTFDYDEHYDYKKERWGRVPVSGRV